MIQRSEAAVLDRGIRQGAVHVYVYIGTDALRRLGSISSSTYAYSCV